MKVSLLISVFCILLVSMFAKAQESDQVQSDPLLIKEDNNLKIFQVRRVIALSDDEQNPKEFFINGGTDLGIKAGYTVEVTRRDSFYDSLRNQNIGDMLIPVGRVKIIHASRQMSVARIDKVYSSSDRPSLEFETFLVGDRLDVSTLKSSKSAVKGSKSGSMEEGETVASSHSKGQTMGSSGYKATNNQAGRGVARVKKKKMKEMTLGAFGDDEIVELSAGDPVAAPVIQ